MAGWLTRRWEGNADNKQLIRRQSVTSTVHLIVVYLYRQYSVLAAAAAADSISATGNSYMQVIGNTLAGYKRANQRVATRLDYRRERWTKRDVTAVFTAFDRFLAGECDTVDQSQTLKLLSGWILRLSDIIFTNLSPFKIFKLCCPDTYAQF